MLTFHLSSGQVTKGHLFFIASVENSLCCGSNLKEQCQNPRAQNDLFMPTQRSKPLTEDSSDVCISVSPPSPCNLPCLCRPCPSTGCTGNLPTAHLVLPILALPTLPGPQTSWGAAPSLPSRQGRQREQSYPCLWNRRGTHCCVPQEVQHGHSSQTLWQCCPPAQTELWLGVSEGLAVKQGGSW